MEPGPKASGWLNWLLSPCLTTSPRGQSYTDSLQDLRAPGPPLQKARELGSKTYRGYETLNSELPWASDDTINSMPSWAAQRRAVEDDIGSQFQGVLSHRHAVQM